MKWLCMVLSLACGVAPVEHQDEPEDASVELIGDAWCSFTFSPSDAARAMTEAAAAQWGEATGCDIRIGEGGVSVELVDRITTDEGAPMCGAALRESGLVTTIQISMATADRCWRPALTLLHEMGHALAPRAPNDGHAEAGLMRAQQDPEATIVDAAAVELVCAELHCGD